MAVKTNIWLFLHSLALPPPTSPDPTGFQTERNVWRNISKQRTAIFLRRIIKASRPSSILQRWEQTPLPNVDDDLKLLRCCTKLKCFGSVNVTFPHEKVNVVRKAARVGRKSNFSNMSTSSGDFHFDGRPVWSRFLRTAFRLSTTLQWSVRRTPVDLTKNFSESILEAVRHPSSEKD